VDVRGVEKRRGGKVGRGRTGGREGRILRYGGKVHTVWNFGGACGGRSVRRDIL